MACAQPFEIKNPHFNDVGYYQWWKQYIEVPCGWCLNCRLDRQNWLSDAMNYEQKKYNYIASFVTFTYDDIHIQDLLNIGKDKFFTYNGEVIPYVYDTPVNYSLRKKDSIDFLKRLRRKINYLYDKNKIKNVDLCRKDFKYALSGEYGDKFGRPHYHFVFFGLDWQFCKDLFESCWQKGIIESLPVTSGCFEYLTKYLIKQVKGDMAKEMFDNKGLERPFFTHSLGLGKGIILDQHDYILAHNLCYKTLNDTLRPVPIYYRNHFFHVRPTRDFSATCQNMIAMCIPPDLDRSQYYKSKNTTIRYSIKKMNQFRHDQALLRHRQLERQCESRGVPVSALNQYKKETYPFTNKDIEYALYRDVVPF